MTYKRKTISKVLGCLLALTLLLGLPPGAALADSTDTAADYVSTATLSFSDSGITETVAGSGYSVSGTTLSISAAGVYAVTGSCSEGNLVVKKATTGVVLILQDLTLSCSTTAPIACNKTSGVTVFATGTNTITDLETDDTLADYEGAAIKVKSGASLTIEGDGTLNVVNRYKNGVKGATAASVIVNMNTSGGALNVTAANHGLASDGGVTIYSGTVKVTAGNEGIKSEYDSTDAEASAETDGYIYIYGGTITVDTQSTSGGDGIQATHLVHIADGAITVNSSADGIQSSGDVEISGGSFDITTYGGYTKSASDSAKGIKAKTDDEDSDSGTAAENHLIITGGSFTLNTADDALHSDGYITITGGDFDIWTGDDGVHADTSLTLGSENNKGVTGSRDPFITVHASYEGLEAGNIYVFSGKYYVAASDDGVNAAGGSSSGSDPGRGGPGGGGFNPGGQPGGGRGFVSLLAGTAYAGSSEYALWIYGGDLYVNANGDGLDANGNIYLYGGNVEVWGQSSGDNEPLDYDGNLTVNGAKIFAAGCTGMGQASPGSGSQSYVNKSASVSSGRVVTVSSGGSTVYQTQAPKSVSYIFYSAPSGSNWTVSSASGSVNCAYGNAWSHSFGSGSASGTTTTYSCSSCDETETQTVAASTAPTVRKTATVSTEGNSTDTEDEGFAVSFTLDDGVEYVQVYTTQDVTGTPYATVASDGTIIYAEGYSGVVSYSSDTGEPDSTGDGQVNFVITLAEGHTLSAVTATEGTYKNIKVVDGDNNVYRVTKIEAETTITVSTENSGIEISSVAVSGTPNQTAYYVGDELVPDGLALTVSYSDGTDEAITYSSANADRFTFSGFDSGAAAEGQTVTVTYGGVSSTFTVSVSSLDDRLYTAEITAPANGTVYVYRTQTVYADGAEADTAITAGNTAMVYARNGGTGNIDSTGSGQINFVVVPENGYFLDGDPVLTGSYKNLKGPTDTGVENAYRITKVEGDLTVTVATDVDSTSLRIGTLTSADGNKTAAWYYYIGSHTVKVTGEDVNADGTVLVAAYNTAGQMLSIGSIAESGGSAAVNEDVATLSIFWVNGSYIPICDCVKYDIE